VIIFVYEYTCALGGGVPPSLAVEGRAMLTAIRDDFARVPGVEVRTLPDDDEDAFFALARTADVSLVIAPEFDDLLTTRCRWVLAAGGRLLGPTPDAVGLTSDKLRLAQHFREHGIPTPVTRLATECVPNPSYPLVYKPRHGAGSLATKIVRNTQELDQSVALLQRELPGDEAIVQPFVTGLPVSVALLVGSHQVIPLLPGFQHLSEDGRFRYRGASIPVSPELAARAVTLGGRAVQSVPGLCGYIGVDMVLGSSADGSGDQIIEINPRLTTSYLGLRALADTNLALALLRLFQGEEMPALSWRSGAVDFTPDGTVVFRPVS
jgi:tyramine---L-glutamate ligase